jgi:hypothetical protein
VAALAILVLVLFTLLFPEAMLLVLDAVLLAADLPLCDGVGAFMSVWP